MKSLDKFNIFNLPILSGLSRKSMAWKFLNINPDDADYATQSLNTYALIKGANILRVHDVKQTKHLVEIYNKIKSS